MRQNINYEKIGGTLFWDYWDFILYSTSLAKTTFSTVATLVLLHRKAVKLKKHGTFTNQYDQWQV